MNFKRVVELPISVDVYIGRIGYFVGYVQTARAERAETEIYIYHVNLSASVSTSTFTPPLSYFFCIFLHFLVFNRIPRISFRSKAALPEWSCDILWLIPRIATFSRSRSRTATDTLWFLQPLSAQLWRPWKSWRFTAR